jgi:hypothetical protein
MKLLIKVQFCNVYHIANTVAENLSQDLFRYILSAVRETTLLGLQLYSKH